MQLILSSLEETERDEVGTTEGQGVKSPLLRARKRGVHCHVLKQHRSARELEEPQRASFLLLGQAAHREGGQGSSSHGGSASFPVKS